MTELRRDDRRRFSPRIAYNAEFAGRVAFAHVQRPGATPRPATARSFIGRNGSLSNPAGAADAANCRRDSAPGSIRVRRCRWSRAGAGRLASCRAPARPGRGLGRRARADRAAWRARGRARGAPNASRPIWDRTLGAIAGPHARRFIRRPGQPLAALSGHCLPAVGALRLLPARRRVRIPRPAAGRDGAARSRGRIWRARTCCAPPAGNLSKATFSTGGTSRAGAACASRCSDDLLWLPFVAAHYVATTGDAACSTSACRFSRRRRSSRDQHEAYGQPEVVRGGRHAVRALPPRHRRRPDRRAPTACRSLAVATGTTA